MTLPLLNGVPPGCGVVCRKCDKDIREYCWVIRACDLGLKDLGGPSKKEIRQ